MNRVYATALLGGLTGLAISAASLFMYGALVVHPQREAKHTVTKSLEYL